MSYNFLRTYVCLVLGLVFLSPGCAMAIEECGVGQCAISNTNRYTVLSSVTDECIDNGTTVTISCNRGFTTLGGKKEFNTMCNGETEEFVDQGSCTLDLASILTCVTVAMVALFAFVLIMYIFFSVERKRRKNKLVLADQARRHGMADDEAIYINAYHPIDNGAFRPIENAQLPPEPEARVHILVDNPAHVHYQNLRLNRREVQSQTQGTDFEMAVIHNQNERDNLPSTSSSQVQNTYDRWIREPEQETSLADRFEMFMAYA